MSAPGELVEEFRRAVLIRYSLLEMAGSDAAASIRTGVEEAEDGGAAMADAYFEALDHAARERLERRVDAATGRALIAAEELLRKGAERLGADLEPDAGTIALVAAGRPDFTWRRR